MNMLTKTVMIATAGAVLAAATPAMARHGDFGRDRIDAGDVIAGALIIGGIAAIASATSNNRNDDRTYHNGGRGRGYDDRGGYGGGYNSANGSRWAVNQCVQAAQREASRYGWAKVTDVTSIDRERGGYEIRGRIVVEQRGYNGRGGRDRYGYNYDRYNDGYDKGKFTCSTNGNRVYDVRLSGLRGGSYGGGYGGNYGGHHGNRY